MDKYCKHYPYFIGGRFSDGTIITRITIPPSCGEQLLLFVFKKISEYHGIIWENPGLGSDGTLLFTTVTFPNDEVRNKCCEEIEEKIETLLENQKAISVLVDFLDNNGGLFDPDTGKLPGFEALEKAFQNSSLDEDEIPKLETALLTLSKFMHSYLIGISHEK